MTDETIVAIYDTAAHAEAAVRDLEAAKVPSGAISSHTNTPTKTQAGTAQKTRGNGFWSNLFGGEPDHDTSVYDRSVDSGSTVVTVKVPDQHVQAVTDILERHNPKDMDGHAASGGTDSTVTTTTTVATPAPATVDASSAPKAAVQAGGEEVLALSEEQLTVGKRLVNRGTTRVRRFVVETPVEETVSLKSEHVSLERRPVAAGTKVTEADFTDRVIEATETAEEAVVAKTARVTEEVVLNKTATDRDETVHDTVRREDVEITRDGDVAHSAGTTQPIPDTKSPRV